MARAFRLPDPGEGIHEAEILEVHVSPGDQVRDGDTLFTVETDKAVIDIPSPFDGTIAEIPVEVGDIVEVGSVLLTFRNGDEAEQPSEEVPAAEEKEEEPSAKKKEEAPAAEEEEGAPAAEEEEKEPAAEKAAVPAGEGASTPGEGDGGRRAPPGGSDRMEFARPVPASPATRSLAKRLGVDLHELEGSGPEGRIEPADVKAAAEKVTAEKPAREAQLRDFEQWGEVEWVDVRGVRRATARHMAEAWERIPHVTHHDVADITGLDAFRRTYAPEVEEAGGKLTITVFLIKAAVAALRKHPRFNASLDEVNDRLAIKKYYHIGVAIDTEDGLIVPVIRDADRKSVMEIAVDLKELAERMRRGDRTLEDMQGGTFTITNPGGIGGASFNPIINHPEVAILGAARARRVPVVREIDRSTEGADFEIVPRLHLPLVLAFDHRVNDGADSARFMNTVRDVLEDFPRFVLTA